MRTSLLLCTALWATAAGAQAQAAPPAENQGGESPATGAQGAEAEAAEPEATDAAPPETAPAATPAPAPEPAADAACVPTCRAGYLCHQGQCISACNPPCGEGEQCTADGTCASAASSAGIGDAQLQAELRKRKEVKQEEVQRWREAHRYDHHLTVDGSLRASVLAVRDGGTASDSGDVVAAGYGVISVGYMHNFVRYFGLRARLSFGFGAVGLGSVRDFDTAGEFTDSDSAFASLIELEVLPYAGTFGPFYVGPLGFVSYRGYDKESLRTDRAGVELYTHRLNDNAVAGTGLGFGTVLGRLQDMHLTWSVRTTFTSTLPAEFAIGFGYRFGRFWSKAHP